MFADESALSKIHFHHSDIWIHDNLLWIRLRKELVVHLSLALQIQQDWSGVTHATSKKILIDLNDLVYIDPSARKLCLSWQNVSSGNAVALYSNNKFLQVMGKAFIVIDSPVWHAEVFSDLNKAVRWLKSDLG